MVVLNTAKNVSKWSSQENESAHGGLIVFKKSPKIKKKLLDINNLKSIAGQLSDEAIQEQDK